MSVNKHKPHLLVLPEDDANRQIATGFTNNLNINIGAIQVVPIADGWKKAVDELKNDYAPKMRQYPQRMIVLLIDFDNDENRLSYVKSQIPDELKERVFILGSRSNPEELKKATEMTLEGIGEALAKDCCENKNELWGHDLLNHNKTELERMILSVKPYLFDFKI